MDLAKIKNLVKQNGDKFVFLENGEPELVVMSFREYEKLTGKQLRESQVIHFSDTEEGNRLKETEFVGPGDMDPPRETRSQVPARLENIRLEDLPI